MPHQPRQKISSPSEWRNIYLLYEQMHEQHPDAANGLLEMARADGNAYTLNEFKGLMLKSYPEIKVRVAEALYTTFVFYAIYRFFKDTCDHRARVWLFEDGARSIMGAEPRVQPCTDDGEGSCVFQASAAPNESVVDAVFAKAARAKARTRAR